MRPAMSVASLDNDNEMKGELIRTPRPHMGIDPGCWRMPTAPDFGWPDMKSPSRLRAINAV